MREIYDLGDELLIVSTDRLSAFDVVLPQGVPDKGRILNLLSAFWFKMLGHIAPTHLLSVDDEDVADAIGMRLPELRGRCSLVVKAKPSPIECIARGYIAGSLYKEYQKSGSVVHGEIYPRGLRDGEVLPEPVFTPSTKNEEGHDENVSFQRVARMVGHSTAIALKTMTLDLYKAAADYAAGVGLILADTKFEFGESGGELLWIDEALTPDSARFWDVSRYRPGKSQASFDKQFVRDFLERINWDKTPPAPDLPPEVIEGTRSRYLEAYRRLVGEELEPLD